MKKPEQPEIYALKKNNDGVSISRKEFLGTLGTVGAGITLMQLGACADNITHDSFGKVEDTGQDLSAFKAHSGAVISICFSPDGKRLVSTAYRDVAIKLWSIPEGGLIETIEDDLVGNSLSLSPDGKYFASESSGTNIKLWPLPGGPCLKTLEGHSGDVESVSFSPDGKILASGSDDHSIKLWSVPEGILLKTLIGHYDAVYSVSFSPDGKTLASGSIDNTIKLWSVSKGILIKTLEGHSNYVNSVIFSPNGEILASGSMDNTIKLWSVPKGILLKTLEGHSGYVKSVKFSPDGRTLASGSMDYTIKLWSLPEGVLLKTLKEHDNSVFQVCFSPDGSFLASGSSDNTIRLWTMPEGKPVYILADPAITEKTRALELRHMGSEIITIPCETPLPEGAVCICDCIAASRNYRGLQTVCTCDTVVVSHDSTLSVGQFVPAILFLWAIMLRLKATKARGQQRWRRRYYFNLLVPKLNSDSSKL